MKGLIAFTLAAAALAWDEEHYGRRTNVRSNGHVGPKGQTSKFGQSYETKEGNFDNWGDRSKTGNGSWYSNPNSKMGRQQPSYGKKTTYTKAPAQKIPDAEPTPYFSKVVYGAAQGVCEMIQVSSQPKTIGGIVVMDQQAEEPVSAQIRLRGLTADTEYELKINEFGNTSADCSMIGDIYNPFAPKEQIVYTQDRWGRPVPHTVIAEDDGRGTFFTKITTDATGSFGVDGFQLYQNLEGDDSIIGKSFTLYEFDDSTPIMCCPVGVGLPYGNLPPIMPDVVEEDDD